MISRHDEIKLKVIFDYLENRYCHGATIYERSFQNHKLLYQRLK